MKKFFDYIFYKLYRWYQYSDNFWEKKGLSPYRKGDLFDPVFTLSCLQGFNLVAIIIFIAIILNIPQYVKEFHYINGGCIIAMYIYNYLHYQRSKRYKEIIKRHSKKETSNIPVLLYAILSLGIAILMFCVIPEEVFIK